MACWNLLVSAAEADTDWSWRLSLYMVGTSDVVRCERYTEY